MNSLKSMCNCRKRRAAGGRHYVAIFDSYHTMGYRHAHHERNSLTSRKASSTKLTKDILATMNPFGRLNTRLRHVG